MFCTILEFHRESFHRIRFYGRMRIPPRIRIRRRKKGSLTWVFVGEEGGNQPRQRKGRLFQLLLFVGEIGGNIYNVVRKGRQPCYDPVQ